jgi:hypothetical protein
MNLLRLRGLQSNRTAAAASSPLRMEACLFSEDFLYVTDLLLNFAGDFFVRAPIS